MKIFKTPNKWLLILSLLSISYFGLSAQANEGSSFNKKSSRPHEVIILNNGLASLEKRLQMIERAKKRIDVEYFIYRTDTSAKIFTQALVKKARQGVKVRMLLDYFMIIGDLNTFYTTELERNGIEVKYFNAVSPLSIRYGQYRNHRKLLAVDGVEAITGGRNIGDEYFDLSSEYNFLDRDIYIKGEIVKSIEETFDTIFASKHSKRLKRERAPRRLDYHSSGPPGKSIGGAGKAGSYTADLKRYNAKIQAAYDFVNKEDVDLDMIRDNAKNFLAEEHSGVCKKISFQSEYALVGIGSGNKDNRILKYGLLDRIKNANFRVLIDSPYFIINNELGTALDVALNKKNKVDVTLLTNSLNSTDAIYVYANFDSHIKSWINRGLEPFIFKGARPAGYNIIESKAGQSRFGVHAKTFVFDDKDIVIGTYNVDPRSANINSEMIVVCEDNKELAAVVSEDVQSRLDISFHLNSGADVKRLEFYEVNFVKRIAYYVTKPLANMFSFLL
jgi:putative cardiolipin synthase